MCVCPCFLGMLMLKCGYADVEGVSRSVTELMYLCSIYGC